MGYQNTTLIMLDAGDAYVYEVTHQKGLCVSLAIKKSFKEFFKTRDGKNYVKENGSNWGDAMFIPFKYLMKNGIISISPLSDLGRLVVNHDDSLLD